MYIKSRVVSLAYKITAMAVCLAGVLLIFGFPNALNLSTIKYYTVQSNLLCLVFLTVSVIQAIVQMKRGGLYGAVTYMPRCKGAVVIAITLTLLVYQFMLTDTPFSMTEGGAGNFFVHFLTPVLMILDWLLFDEKGHYRVSDPLWWTVIPLCYLAYALVAAPIGVTYIGGSRYPYFFLDIDVIGVTGVVRYVLMITVVFLVLGYLIFGLDKWMGRQAKTADEQKTTQEIQRMERTL
ncbi:MAG: Pr6Pr family membrane protein [Oscillospiraceae bacterium]|nr:Pr6Pr family membrane protein [Oscillospiraceae bacterium]